MTAKTSQKLADALRAAGLIDLAARAEKDEFHDFLSRWSEPASVLDRALIDASKHAVDVMHKAAIQHIRVRLHDGDFDASKEESDAWAASVEGKQALENWKDGIDR